MTAPLPPSAPTTPPKRRGPLFWVAIGAGGLVTLLCLCVGLAGLGAKTNPTPTAIAAQVVAVPPSAPATDTPEATRAPSATSSPTDEPTPEPTNEPTATVVPVASGPSPELRAYFLKMSQPMGDLATGLRQLGALMGEPKLADASWKTDMAVQLVLIRTAHEQIKAIDPVPDEAQTLHAGVIDASTDCNAMTYSLADGIDTLNTSKLQDALKLMQSCSTKIQNAQPLLDELTVN